MIKNYILLLCTYFLASTAALANGPSSVLRCQNVKPLEIDKWEFTVETQVEKPTWFAEKNAEELYKAQNQYYSGKSSPFINQVLPITLGYTQPGMTVKISPKVLMNPTVGGKTCATVIGIKALIITKPVIQLPKELIARDCVSTAALNHQLKHVEVVNIITAEAKSKPDVFKPAVFAIFQNAGVMGKNQEELTSGFKGVEKLVEKAMFDKLAPYVRQQRRQAVDNNATIKKLYETCEGKFEKSTKLAKK